MSGELRLRLLGGLEVTLGDTPLIGFVSGKAQALLCYLAVTGRPQTRAELAGLLWGDMPDSAAATNLRKALSNLKQLAAPHLIITRQAVAFDRDSPYRLDVEAFRAAFPADPREQSPETLRHAIHLYRGDFLQGFYVREAPAFEEWMLLERERLKDLAVQGMATLASLHTARGEYAAALEYTSRLLALEPWREEAHREMMLLLARSGQRSAALAQYEICRRMLADELGVAPTPETTALYERIREATAAPPHNLPLPATPFVGRAEELAEISRLLDRPACRLLSLAGLGGIGKTRLALEAARAKIGAFLHGVYFVPLASLRSVEFLLPAIAEAVGFSLYGATDAKGELYNFLREKEMLLVLDGLEHLPGAAELVAEILARAPGVKVLATSRERLRLQEEWVLVVPGLRVPAGARDNRAEEYSAVQLFLERARRTDVHAMLEEAEIPHAVRICQLVEGMPLAIELASAWVGAIPCREIESEIEHNRDFLITSLRNVPERHRSLRAVFEYSWASLSETEQDVFAKLSVFRGGFRRSTAEEATDATLSLLSALVDKSLLTRTDAGRYQIHDLVRQFAGEKLAEQGGAERLSHRHLDIYLRMAEAADLELHGPNQLDWLERLEEEHDNLRAALEWALQRAREGSSWPPEAALRLAGALGQFWDLHGQLTEGRQWLEAALKVEAPAIPTPQWRASTAKALYWAGHLAKWQGDYRQAAEWAEASLALCRELGDPWSLAYSLYLSGSVATKQGEFEAAKIWLDESLSLFRQVKAKWGTAHALGMLGNIARAQIGLEQAVPLWQECLRLHREVGDRRGIARSLNRLWQWPYQHGDYEEASAMLQEAIGLFQKLRHKAGIANSLRYLGLVAQAQDDLARAATLYEESRDLYHELGNIQGQVYTNWYLGRLALYDGDIATAKVRLDTSLQQARQVGNKGLIAWILQARASVAQQEQDYPAARSLLTDCLNLALESGEIEVLADALESFAALAAAQGEPQRAARLFAAAEALYTTATLTLPPEIRAEHERDVQAARSQMEASAFVAAWNEGRAMTTGQAIAYALGVDGGVERRDLQPQSS